MYICCEIECFHKDINCANIIPVVLTVMFLAVQIAMSCLGLKFSNQSEHEAIFSSKIDALLIICFPMQIES